MTDQLTEVDKLADDCRHPMLVDSPSQPGVNVYVCASCFAAVRLMEFEVHRKRAAVEAKR